MLYIFREGTTIRVLRHPLRHAVCDLVSNQRRIFFDCLLDNRYVLGDLSCDDPIQEAFLCEGPALDPKLFSIHNHFGLGNNLGFQDFGLGYVVVVYINVGECVVHSLWDHAFRYSVCDWRGKWASHSNTHSVFVIGVLRVRHPVHVPGILRHPASLLTTRRWDGRNTSTRRWDGGVQGDGGRNTSTRRWDGGVRRWDGRNTSTRRWDGASNRWGGWDGHWPLRNFQFRAQLFDGLILSPSIGDGDPVVLCSCHNILSEVPLTLSLLQVL